MFLRVHIVGWSITTFILYNLVLWLLISTNQIARFQEFSLSTLHTKGQSLKGCRNLKCLHDNTFLPRRQTLGGSLG
jgi:hypothetical protein